MPPSTPVDEPPYRGLWPFQADQSEVFYGRTRLTAELTAHVEACLTDTGMALVTGASGAGKSSLIRAGLIPAIADGRMPVEGSTDWPVAIVTPGPRPLEALAQRLSQLSGTDAGSIRNTLAARPREAYLYARQAVFTHTDGMEPERRDRVRESGRLLLFVDQFEELFTLCRDEAERGAFTAALFAIASGGDERSGVVVIGVRGDFIDRCSAIPELIPVLRRHAFVVGPPEPEELRQVITGPAAAAGLALDQGLADDILADLRSASTGAYTAGALPLLSQTMLSIWQHRDGDRLTRAAYERIGGVGRAIEASAEQVFQRLDPPQQARAAELFRRLTVVDRRGEVSRRRARRSRMLAELPGLAPVLEAFTAARLVVMVGDTVEIAHDVLLRSWKRLDDWLLEDRMHRALLTEVADDAAAWLEHGKDPSFLYRGAKFTAAEATRAAWNSNPDTYREWNSGVESFLDASRAAATRRARVRRTVTASLAVLLVVSLTATGIALNLNRIAADANEELTEERDRLLAEDLAEASAENAGLDGDLSRLLAAAAWQMDPSEANFDAMVTAVTDPVRYTGEPHVGGAESIAFSPDGDYLASFGADSDLVLWDLAEREETDRLEGVDGSESIAFSPDGGRLAVAGVGQIQVVETADFSKEPILLERERSTEAFRTVGFDGSGSLLAATDEELIRFDLATGERTSPPAWGIEGVEDFGFQVASGRFLISGDGGLWSSAGPEAEAEQTWTSSSGYYRVAPGGRFVVEWAHGALTLYDLESGAPIRTATVDIGFSGAAVDADGSTIALSSEVGVHYIETESMTPVESFDTGYEGRIDASFNADGTLLAVTGEEGTRIWELDGTELAEEPLFAEPELPGRLVRILPDESTVMIVDAGTYRLFDIASGQERDVAWEADDWMTHVGFSPDGRWTTVVDGENLSRGEDVTLELDDHATIIDAETGREQLVIEPINGEVAVFGYDAIAFSSDGSLVASAMDQRLRIWNVEEGAMVAEATGDYSGVTPVAFSLNAERVVGLGDDAPIVYDLGDDELRVMDEPSSGALFDISASPGITADGRYVLNLSGNRRSVEVWDADTRAHVGTLAMTGGPLIQTHLPSASAVLGVGEDGVGYRFDLGFLDDPHAALCERTGRELTDTEWSEYLPGIDSREIC